MYATATFKVYHKPIKKAFKHLQNPPRVKSWKLKEQWRIMGTEADVVSEVLNFADTDTIKYKFIQPVTEYAPTAYQRVKIQRDGLQYYLED